MKRVASSGLSGRPSPYHSSVILYEPATDEPRRSKRIKIKEEATVSTVESDGPNRPGNNSKRVEKFVVKYDETQSSEGKIQGSVSPRKLKSVPQSLAVPHPAPSQWQEAYDTIKRMREHIVAPVDTMGCDQAQFKEVDPKVCHRRMAVSGMVIDQRRETESSFLDFSLLDVVLPDERRSHRCGRL